MKRPNERGRNELPREEAKQRGRQEVSERRRRRDERKVVLEDQPRNQRRRGANGDSRVRDSAYLLFA